MPALGPCDALPPPTVAKPCADRKGLRPAPRLQEILAPLNDAPTPRRVPILGKLALEAILAELAQAMQDCRQLYLSCVSPSPGFQQAAMQQLAASQDRLHRGLLAKIYATIAEADGRWTFEEQRCVTALLQHVGVPWSPDQLAQTAHKVARQAAKLEWARLLQPFRAIPELRARTADLETVVVRVANLIAKADGLVAAKETAVLHAIQAEFRTERLSAAAGPPPTAASAAADADLPWVGAVVPHRTKRLKSDAASQREQSLRKLDSLVGLRHVKQEIRALADWAFLQNQRRQAKLPCEPTDTRFLFVGRAGTGKTQVARLLSEILAASGVLKRGQLVEANGFDLVSREPGDAANVIKAKLRDAIGGTLLIEYAGALFSAGESSTANVLRALQQNLVAHAGRLAVVLADHSDRLLSVLDRNADWQPMFRRYWRFDDYRAGELGQILQFHCNRSQYQVTRLAQIKLLLGFDWHLHQDAERFGFGHGVQRVFERAVHQLAGRIAGISPLTKPLLTTFQDADIVFDGVPEEVFGNLADPRRTFTIRCPGCESVNVVGPEFLGIGVECMRCQHRFVCAWGEPND
jgi:tellurite resistance protein